MNFNPANGVSFQYTSVDLAEQSSYLHYIKRLSATLSGLTAVKDRELFFNGTGYSLLSFSSAYGITLF
jgi:hypothetical protein